MKKTLCVLALLCGMVPLGASAQTPTELKNDVDSVSYYLGMDIGSSIKNMYADFEPDKLITGLREGIMLGDDYDSDVVHAYLRDFFQNRLPLRKLEEAESYLAEVAQLPGVGETPSGLYYEILDQWDMRYRAVEDDDSVEVTYKGSLTDGTVIDENDVGVVFQVNRVIPGFAEGLKLVGKGGRLKLYIHPDLGYGSQGNMRIPPNAVLIFEISVIDAPEVYDNE